MLTVLALSSVIQKPIQTRWPILLRVNETSPMTKLVTGRGVDTTNPVDIMWTTTTSTNEPPIINHFVPLLALSFAVCDSGTQDTVELEVADAADVDTDAASDNDNSCPLPKGEPLDGHFMCTVDCVKVLCDDNYKPRYETMPRGVKEDVMYKVKVHREKRTCKFWDDCGAWEGTHVKKHYT